MQGKASSVREGSSQSRLERRDVLVSTEVSNLPQSCCPSAVVPSFLSMILLLISFPLHLSFTLLCQAGLHGFLRANGIESPRETG